MACINPDGTLTRSAKALLSLIDTPLTPDEISEKLGEPLFKVRSSLREMGAAKLVKETAEGKHVITEMGKEARSL